MAGQTIQVSVLADTKKFSRAMKGLGKETGFSKLAAGAKKVGKALAVAGAAAAAMALVWGKKLIEAGERAATANARIENIANSMNLFGKEAGKVSGRLVKLAEATARNTGVDQNAIKATQAKLLTFKNIAGTADEVGGAFDRATAAAVDLEAAGFGSAEQAALQLGKALNDPTTGIAALNRVGLQFTEAEKEKIKTMQESGDIAGAQQIILAGLEQQVGGTAEATANATDKMKVRWSQFQEMMGLKLMPILDKVSEWFIDVAVPALEELAKTVKQRAMPVLRNMADIFKREVLPRLKDLGAWIQREVLPRLKELGGWITGTLVPALRDFAKWVVDNKDWLAALAVTVGVIVVGIQAYVKVIAIWRAAVVVATAAQAAFNAIMAANPIGLIVLAIAALVAGLVYFFTQTETGKKIWDGFTKALSVGWEAIKKAFKVGWEAVKNWLQKAWDFIKKVWSYSPLGLVTSNWGKITGAFKTGRDKVVGWLQKAWDFIKKVWSYSPLGLVTGNWNKIIGWFKDLPGKLMSGLGNLKTRITQPFKNAFNNIARFWNRTVGRLSFQAPDWVPGMGGKGFSVPKIPMLAQGGIATRATLAMIGEGRESEAILPLSKLRALLGDVGGGRVNHYEIHVHTGVGDPVAIGREVSNSIRAYERANGGRR